VSIEHKVQSVFLEIFREEKYTLSSTEIRTPFVA